MITYLDSSVILRMLLDQPDPLKEWKQISFAVASTLAKIECVRTLDRLMPMGHLSRDIFLEAKTELHTLLSAIELLPIREHVLLSAEQSFGYPVATLDALHLCTALDWMSSQTASIKEEFRFATHDTQLARAAAATGLKVVGV